MKLELEAREADLLRQVLDHADRERQIQIHRSESPDFRRRLQQEADVLEAIRSRLGAAPTREERIDESVEQSFPASDPPARGGSSGA